MFLEGKKTVIFFVITLIVALASMFGFTEYQPTMDQSELILAIVSLVGLSLRYLTKTPIFKKS